MTTKTLIGKLTMLVSALLLSAGFMTASPPVTMKLLILAWDSNDISYQSLARDLGQIGVPYQTVFVNNLTPDGSGNRLSELTLADSANGRGLYQGIIETDSTFRVCTTTCTSLLSAPDVSKLNSYASQYSVRMVCYYGWPDATWGLQPGDSGASYTATNPLNVTLTAAGAAVFPYLNPAAVIPVSGRFGGIWVYKALPVAAANETTTPILMAGTNVVGVTHTTADGRQTLALTMDNYPAYLHSTAFSYGVINWVTNGVFLGSRRVYLNPEIDDLLLGNRLYAPTLPECPNDPSCPTYYATGSDLQGLADWQTNLQSNPLFQSFHQTFAYNGIGTIWFDPTDPVFAAIASLSSRFTWVSHTWDHANLDCYATDSNGNCIPATLAQSQAELNQDIAVAGSLGITLDGTDMVTPYNSGMNNPSFLQAAAQAGLKYIVYAGDPPSTQTGLVSPLVPSIFEIARRTPDMYFDVSTPLTGVSGSWPDEYNAEYGPDGTTPTYTSNQTYSQILDILSDSMLRTNMLSFEPYPLAFHMDNMFLYDGTHSILSDLMDAAITKYTGIFSLPVLTLDLNAIAPLLQNRASYDASGVVGVYTPGVSVMLTTNNAATIPVTGICSQPSCGTYGAQIQDNVVLAANSTVTIPLTASGAVSFYSLEVNPASVTGGASATGTVTLGGAAPTGGAFVSLSSNNASATLPASVTVAAGSKTATFTVSTSAVASSVSATLTASYNSASKTAALTITPPASVALSSVAVNPTSVIGGASATGTVTLGSAAPSGGIAVSLSSNNASATVPASVTVAAGSKTATFTVSTSAVTSSVSATLTASYNSASKTAALTITPPASVALSSVAVNPTSVTSFTSSTGTVTLSAVAPTGGVSVSLSSDNAAAAVPASVTVAAGNKTATFTLTTYSVAYWTSATITATYNSVSKTAALTVTPSASFSLSSVSVNPASVTTGTSATGTVTLSAAAPAGGIAVELWTTGTVAFVPVTVSIAAGSTTGTFTVTTNYTTSTLQDTITAYYNGATKTANITVTP